MSYILCTVYVTSRFNFWRLVSSRTTHERGPVTGKYLILTSEMALKQKTDKIHDTKYDDDDEYDDDDDDDDDGYDDNDDDGDDENDNYDHDDDGNNGNGNSDDDDDDDIDDDDEVPN